VSITHLSNAHLSISAFRTSTPAARFPSQCNWQVIIPYLNIANLIYSDPALLEDRCSETDVVKEHHRRNCFPHAPDPQGLHDIRQSLDSVAPFSRDAKPSGSLTDCILDAAEHASIPPGELKGHPTKLRSYPPKFREIIEHAKQLAQCAAAMDPFPSRTSFISEKSAQYITEAIAEREEKGIFIPAGESVTLTNQILIDNGQDIGRNITKISALW